jgi:glycosyltransferase involved in cell wall biosynthesis
VLSAVHQILPALLYGDAIGNYALALRRLFREWGYRSEIFAAQLDARAAEDARPLDAFDAQSDSITVYHYAVGCKDATERFLRAAGRRVLIYHNITPPHFYAPYGAHAYRLAREGRASLGVFRGAVDLALAVSEFNRRELVAAGYENARLLPLHLDLERFARAAPDAALLRRFSDGWTNFLFVGRLAPNKRHEDVIRIFAWYHRFVDRRTRLLLVGGCDEGAPYRAALGEVARCLDVEDHVVLLGHVSFAALVACYRCADVFVCMSEHEGICVPLLEAMHHDVPVVAYACAGVPDTLGDAGVLVKRKDVPVVAEVIAALLSDARLRQRVVHRQRQRLTEYLGCSAAACLKDYLERLESRDEAAADAGPERGDQADATVIVGPAG